MKKGFTLIELLIVITVISILIGIALPRFKGMQDEGNIAKAKAELRTLQTAVESYYIHNSNTYPSALSSLTSATPNIIGSTLPTDPFNGTNNYGVATDGASPVKYYVLYSVGPGANGSAAVSTAGVVTETNGSSCIYVSNAGQDTTP
ncbi:MAG: type II secretion system GspH family protein [Candidatus Omnitrophica bacterium]|nr:type II secretion system GspH family protein [Candidatus Omnitrophota bacterium]